MKYPGPLTQIALGFILGFAVLGGAACATLPECETSAVRNVLGKRPSPEQVTLGDVRDIAGRLKACAATDGGR